MKTADEILSMVNEFLANLPYERKPKSLYEPIRYVLSMGGKRIRPTLMLLGYNLFKDNPEKILMNAVALETYHNYTLLHDDLMDNADLRRGHETVHKKWDANTAILSGDSMLVLAYERMAQCDEKHLAKVLKLFTTTALEIGEGQQFDMEFENRNDVKEEEYIEMIRLKTSVLLGAALEIGAYIADAPESDRQALEVFGTNIGLAFQIQDDILDVYGDEATFGKAIGGDILQNKKSLALLMALHHANEDQLFRLQGWLHRTEYLPEEKIKAVTAIYNEIGVRELCQAEMDRYTQIAIEALKQLSVDATPLLQLADKLHQRNN